jgi:ComF family protein
MHGDVLQRRQFAAGKLGAGNIWCPGRSEKVHTALSHLKAEMLELLLPACCLLCGQRCPHRLLCPDCAADLPRIGDSCRQCALPGGFGATRLCADCLRHPPPWDHATAGLVYEYPIDHLVRRFKFHRNMVCGQLLADELVRAVRASYAPPGGLGDKPAPAMPDLLVPVPLHFWRRGKRGFNQAEVLAMELQKHCGIPLRCDLLRRTTATSAQSGLDRKTRLRNLRNAFQCRPFGGAHVALVDDVLTTGATLQECTSVLKRAGASQVTVWVAARVPAPAQQA